MEVFQGAEVSLRMLSIVASSSVKRDARPGVLQCKLGAGKGSLGAKQDKSPVDAKSSTNGSLDRIDNLRTTIVKSSGIQTRSRHWERWRKKGYESYMKQDGRNQDHPVHSQVTIPSQCLVCTIISVGGTAVGSANPYIRRYEVLRKCFGTRKQSRFNF